jgi:thymidine kinase
MGHLTVIAGPMFAGKSEEIIDIIKRAGYAKKHILTLKPGLDTRQETIRARELINGNSVTVAEYSAWSVSNNQQFQKLIEDYQPKILVIDEAQFFENWIVTAVNDLLLTTEITIYVAGLDQSFLGTDFGPMGALMAIANKVRKLTAVCFVCGEPANRTYRLIDSQEVIVVGDVVQYQARCNSCYNLKK